MFTLEDMGLGTKRPYRLISVDNWLFSYPQDTAVVLVVYRYAVFGER